MHKLKEWRHSFKKPISLAKMAVLLGYKPSAASKVFYWENGRVPSPEDMVNIEQITKGKVKLKHFYYHNVD